ncbi:uncharacterized protein N7484_010720 [Penicillium longicatenatum]|uniref:uncharacterized protein n=1 Tax=Penicillium longicatenatum TaxID=1561947 RepID=UPI002546D56A|nr:uncharacterized protein N7484_010720 [Penicillium longicatenatum]KAJ5630620.1 hypothetical protein N7484_010720 [Penicillium longicatenatum]
MAARMSRSPSDDSHFEIVRKRVGKACDRCRMKKSKCDTATPCSRCRSDNAICVFGGNNKAAEKEYPHGYAEKLEQQQAWLVNGLQELYRRINEGEGWPGEHLKLKPNGQPLIHDILKRLGALDLVIGQRFEENTKLIQRRLWRRDTQCHASADDSFTDMQSPVLHPYLSSDVSSQHSEPYSLSKRIPMPDTSQGIASSIQGDVSPVTHQHEPKKWQGSSECAFNLFDELNMMPTPDYSNLVFDERIPPSIFSYQLPMDCIVPNEYEDLYQLGGTD